MPNVICETEDFPYGSATNGWSEPTLTWDEVLWAAITVGRPNRHAVVQHGVPSMYEAIFRWSLIRMALEQRGVGGTRFCRTAALKTLDPTEKGAVSYFLGMTFCKAMAAKRLNTPWLIHLDVFRPQLDAVLRGRSRPDLVGKELGANIWHAFESKGRASPPNNDVKAKAKQQADRLVSINGIVCSLHVGAITYFKNDTVQFYWVDPPANEKRQIRVPFDDEAWRAYYLPAWQAINSAGSDGASAAGAVLSAFLPELDIKVAVHPVVATHLADEAWGEAQRAAEERREELAAEGYRPDGLMVRAGDSWLRRFDEGADIDG